VALPVCLAIPGEVLSVRDMDGVRYADVRFGGIVREVCLHAFPATTPGEFVLVHVGFAIAKIDRAEAERTLELLMQLGDSEALEAAAENPFAETAGNA
jgi:hydrogenase expression/formation protein HypC